MSLNLKYRGKMFKDLIGNETVKKSLLAKTKKKDRPHSYLLIGPAGCGKTTVGRILAIKFGAMKKDDDPLVAMDYREFDTSHFGGIDVVRSIRETMHSAPMTGKSKVFLLDECHGLTKPAQEALLKAIEEPPSHVYFVLCTTEPEKLKSTFKRRCATYEMSPVDEETLLDFLRGICKTEGIKASSKTLDVIVENSEGSPGRALMKLEEIKDLKPKEMLEAAKRAEHIKAQSIELARKLYGKGSWKVVSAILRDLRNENHESIRRLVRGYCQSILLKKDDQRAYLIMDTFGQPFYDDGYGMLITACYEVVKGGS